MQASRDDLLVALHGREQVRRRQVRHRRQRSHPPDELGQGGVVALAHQAAVGREPGRDQHAVRHRLAVPETPVPGDRLEGVSGRVPEVQDPAPPPFALVGGDHLGLDSTRCGDDVHQELRLPREDLRQAVCEPVEERPIGDDPVLDDLVEARAQLAAGQGVEQLGVGDDRGGGMKGADQVLAERVVDPDLAADGAVHLREQGGRHVHEVHAAEIGRGREPGGVAEHPAPDRDDRRLPVRPGADQGLVDARHGVQGLRALSVRHEQGLDLRQRGLNRLAVPGPHRRTGDEKPPVSDFRLGEPPVHRGGEAVGHEDGVGPGCAFDVDAGRFHGGSVVSAERAAPPAWHPAAEGAAAFERRCIIPPACVARGLPWPICPHALSGKAPRRRRRPPGAVRRGIRRRLPEAQSGMVG